jgi:hypothetical protein
MDRLEVPKTIRAIAEKGHIDADDVLGLRRRFYDDGAVRSAEADHLFWLNDACAAACPQWHGFYVEALTDFFVNQRRPRGYIDEEGAEDIAARILNDGRVRSASEMELLVSIIEKARSVPEKLIVFVIGEVRVSVLEGEGPIRGGLRLEPGVIADAEVDVLRRVIYGMASEGNVKVTRLEAELLFDLNDSIVGAENHAGWAELFVDAIANYVMAAELWAPRPAEDVARHEAWLEQREGALGFMRRLARSGIGGALDALKCDADGEAAMRRAAREEEIAGAAMITAEEAEWLARRIGRDGTIHDNERAVLRRLSARAGELHPAIRELVEKVA